MTKTKNRKKKKIKNKTKKKKPAEKLVMWKQNGRRLTE